MFQMEQADKYRGRKSKAGPGLESLQRSREAEEEDAEKTQPSVPLWRLRVLPSVAVKILHALCSPFL